MGKLPAPTSTLVTHGRHPNNCEKNGNLNFSASQLFKHSITRELEIVTLVPQNYAARSNATPLYASSMALASPADAAPAPAFFFFLLRFFFFDTVSRMAWVSASTDLSELNVEGTNSMPVT